MDPLKYFALMSPDGAAGQAGAATPTAPGTPGSTSGGGDPSPDPRIAQLESENAELRRGLTSKGEEFSRFKARLSAYPEFDKLKHWDETGSLPSVSSATPAAGGDADQMELLKQAVLEGDEAALMRVLDHRDSALAAKLGKQDEATGRKVTEVTSKLAAMQVSSRDDVDADLLRDGSEFWQWLPSHLRQPKNQWIDVMYTSDPERALYLAYKDYTASNGDPLEAKRKAEKTALAREASLEPGAGGLPPGAAELAKEKGRKLSMYEIAQLRAAARGENL